MIVEKGHPGIILEMTMTVEDSTTDNQQSWK